VEGLGLLVILFCFGLAGGIVGKIKGSSFLVWFGVSFCVPFLGLVAALLYRYDTLEPRRRCPTCGKLLKVHHALCTRCGSDLSYPDPHELLPSESEAHERARAAGG